MEKLINHLSLNNFCLIQPEISLQRPFILTSPHSGKKTTKQIEGKIKIGYFSPDFREHPTLYLMMDVFKLHDHSKFDVYAFSFGPRGTGKAYNNSKTFFTKFFDIKKYILI